MIENCIFCKIGCGEISSHKVYEDEQVFAFLDMHPIRPGHTLVIPKKHEPDFYRLDDETYQAVMSAVKKIAVKVQDTLAPKRTGLIVAGWDVPHTHVHVVPMEEHHDITSKALIEGNRANPTNEELAEVAGKIRM